jgi:hypothetical protein
MVRFDTYNASAHLVRQIEQSGTAAVIHDGGDNVLVRLDTGQQISIYLIETIMPLYEIRMTLVENGVNGIHTLFIPWAAMFLPEEGDLFQTDEWLIGLLQLYDNKIYAFDVYGKDIRIFPVHFHARNTHHTVTYGDDVDVTRLGCDVVEVNYPLPLRGSWWVADFAHEQRAPHPQAAAPPTPWEILGLSRESEREYVKQVYRRLARQYHPDINDSTDATVRMQELNDAYRAVLLELDSQQAHR